MANWERKNQKRTPPKMKSNQTAEVTQNQDERICVPLGKEEGSRGTVYSAWYPKKEFSFCAVKILPTYHVT